jgi:hypothetical protein
MHDKGVVDGEVVECVIGHEERLHEALAVSG